MNEPQVYVTPEDQIYNPISPMCSTYSAQVVWLTKFFWIFPLTFYWITASRVPGWIDAPMIARNVHQILTGTWVNIHNLFHIFGRLWTLLIPWGDFHYRLNLLCGLFGAITVHFIFLNGLKMTRNPTASILGAIAVMFGHSLWWHSTILEVYTLNTALIGILLHYILRYQDSENLADLYKAVFVFGLGVSNHILMGLFGFGFVVLALHPCQWRKIFRPIILIRIFFVFVLALQIFLFIFLKEFNDHLIQQGAKTFHDHWLILRDMLDGWTGGHFKNHIFPNYMNDHQKWNWRLNYFFLLFMNYPSIAFLAGWTGLVVLIRRRDLRFFNYFFLTGILVQTCWSSNYMIWDMYAFGLPVWILFGTLTPLGFDFFASRSLAWKKVVLILSCTLLIGPYVYSQIPKWDKEKGFWMDYFSFFNYVSNLWDASLYFGNPNKLHYQATTEIAEIFFKNMPFGAHIYDDDGKGHYPFNLYYQNVLKRRLDIRFHPIFGPELNQEGIKRSASELLGLLERGERVFISSPFWPERPILNEIYARLSLSRRVSPDQVGAMTSEELENTFPKYALERIPMSQDGRFFIYEFKKRDESHDPVSLLKNWVIEGEDMVVLDASSGFYFSQDIVGWSGGRHLLWLDAKPKASLDLLFFIHREIEAELFLCHTTSYDFGRFQVFLDAEKILDETEGYTRNTERSKEISLGKHQLSPKSYVLQITMTGTHMDANPRHGFGLDYLRIKADE
ncbi:membrane hypothetical protein [Gammaproteobacteria bacterium]